MDWITTGSRPIAVAHDSNMDGGGTWFGQDYITEIRRRYPGRVFDHCLEWCSGPGFIGYNILSHGLAHRVSFQDLYAPAIEKVQETARNHGLDVGAYVSDSVRGLPQDIYFDLVVANPPHYLECPGNDNYQRIAVDRGWSAHREFYQNIRPRLTENGVILIQENQAGSIRGVEEFREMIENNGLEITDVSESTHFWNQPGPWAQIYYIEIRLKK